jgi:hypothetical protein
MTRFTRAADRTRQDQALTTLAVFLSAFLAVVGLLAFTFWRDSRGLASAPPASAQLASQEQRP